MRTLLAMLVVAAVVGVGVMLLAGGRSDRRTTTTSTGTDTVALQSVPAPHLTAEQINRQDQPDVRRQRDEAWAFDRRPLLNALPATLHGVRFDIGGLDEDGQTTIVVATAKKLGRRHARIAYETLVRRTGDRSRSYRLEIRP